MASLENTDAAFAAGTPLLRFFEPALFLLFLALFARSSVGRNRDSLYAQLFSAGLVGGRRRIRDRPRAHLVRGQILECVARSRQATRSSRRDVCPRLRSW